MCYRFLCFWWSGEEWPSMSDWLYFNTISRHTWGGRREGERMLNTVRKKWDKPYPKWLQSLNGPYWPWLCDKTKMRWGVGVEIFEMDKAEFAENLPCTDRMWVHLWHQEDLTGHHSHPLSELWFDLWEWQKNSPIDTIMTRWRLFLRFYICSLTFILWSLTVYKDGCWRLPIEISHVEACWVAYNVSWDGNNKACFPSV